MFVYEEEKREVSLVTVCDRLTHLVAEKKVFNNEERSNKDNSVPLRYRRGR